MPAQHGQTVKPLTLPQKWLILGGLLLALLGLVYGLVYTYIVDHQTLPRLREHYRGAFVAAAEGDAAQVESELEEGQAMNYRYVRAIDVHTHWLKMASVAILLGLILPLVQWNRKARRALAVVFLAGGLIFPLGVFAQIVSDSVVPQAVAAGGAALAIVSVAGVLWRLVTLPDSEPPNPSP